MSVKVRHRFPQAISAEFRNISHGTFFVAEEGSPPMMKLDPPLTDGMARVGNTLAFIGPKGTPTLMNTGDEDRVILCNVEINVDVKRPKQKKDQ